MKLGENPAQFYLCVCHAGQDDDSWVKSASLRLPDLGQEELREEEVAEVVGAELNVEPVLGLHLGETHNT